MHFVTFSALYFSAQLVPVYCFGENELFNQAQHPWLRMIQDKVRALSSVAPIMFYGRGFFTSDFGIMPFRVPMNTVGKYDCTSKDQ